MSFVTGEVDATRKPDLGFPGTRDAQVILHDHSGTGFPAWVGLMNGGAPAGVVSFNGSGLELVSPDVSTNTPNGQIFGAAALHRFTRPPGVGTASGFSRVYLVFDWSLRVFRSASGIFTFTKGVDFGLDTGDWGSAAGGGAGIGGLEPVSANRTLVQARCTMYDESLATYYGGKWQMQSGSAGAPAFIDLKDLSGNLISPSTAGYEPLLVGMNYGKWIRQRSELVVDLTPVPIAGAQVALSVTNNSTTSTYTGSQVPILGSAIVGTSVAVGTWVAGVNTGTSTVTLSQAATATTSTTAGASFAGALVTGRLEGLRHNGVGFGSLAVGATGYSRDTTVSPRANELLAQQATANANGAVVPALSQDAGFQGGMNVYVQIDNRSTQNSKAKLVINRARVSVF